MSLFGKKKELPIMEVPEPERPELPPVPRPQQAQTFGQESISIAEIIHKDIQKIGQGLNTIYNKLIEIEQRQEDLENDIENIKILNINIKGEDENKGTGKD